MVINNATFKPHPKLHLVPQENNSNIGVPVYRAIDLVYFFWITLAMLAGIAVLASNNESPYFWMIGFSVLITLIIKHIKNPPLLILLIFLTSYMFVPYYFFQQGLRIAIYESYQLAHYLNTVTLANLLFLSSFGLLVNSTRPKMLPRSQELTRPNQTVFFLCGIVCIYALHFGISGETILTSVYGQGDSQKTALHEYFILPFMGMLLSRSAHNYFQGAILLLLLVAYSIKTLIYGGRIEVIQVGLLYVYLMWSFLKDFSPWKLISLLTSMYIALTIMSVLRWAAAEQLADFSIQDLLAAAFESDHSTFGFISTNSGDVTHASMRVLGLIDDGYLNQWQKVESFFFFIFGTLIPSEFYPDHAILSSYMQREIEAGGGGLIGNYFYVWLGWCGPIIAGIAVGYAVSRLYKSENFYTRIYAILILISFPRWFAYSPIHLLKFCLIGVVLIGIMYALASLTHKVTVTLKTQNTR